MCRCFIQKQMYSEKKLGMGWHGYRRVVGFLKKLFINGKKLVMQMRFWEHGWDIR